jgi:hypothetical protein
MAEEYPVQQQNDENSQQNEQNGSRRRTVRQRLDIRPRRTGRTVVIPKKDVEKLDVKVNELENVVNHSFAPSGTLFVEFKDVKNSGEFFSKINAQCKKDGLGRHTVKTSLYASFVAAHNRDLAENTIQDTVKLVREAVLKVAPDANVLMVNWIKSRNYGKVFLDRKPDLDTLVDKGRVHLSDETGETAPALTFRYWRNQRRNDVNRTDNSNRNYTNTRHTGYTGHTAHTAHTEHTEHTVPTVPTVHTAPEV